MRVVLLSFAFVALTLFGSVLFNAEAQSPTPTPQGIYGVLLDTNALIYCQIVQQPIDPIFQTATAAPTKTTVPIASPTFVMPPTPTQEIWTATPPRMTVQIAAINVRNAASLTGAIQYVVTQGQVLNVTSNTVTAGGYVWRQLTDGFWLVEKNLSNGQVWLSPIQ